MLTDMAAETRDLKHAVDGSITEIMANWLASQYALVVREQLAGLPSGPERFKLVRLVTTDLTALRRGDHSAERLVLDRERLAFERECVERAKAAEFWKWTKQPEIRRKLWPQKRNGITQKTLRKVERELNLI